AGGFARAAPRGAGGDLRRLFAWGGGSGLPTSPAAQPSRKGGRASGGGRSLAKEGIWLVRVVVPLIPNEREAMGLLALMLSAHSRREARRDALGRYVPLGDQPVGGGDR